jgi:uncharacterized small protein (DUF1192 family)
MVDPMRMAETLRPGYGPRENEMAQQDDEPLTKRRRLEPLLLDSLGIAELHSYIDELKTEIARVEADIGRKNNHRSAADAFFKRP